MGWAVRMGRMVRGTVGGKLKLLYCRVRKCILPALQ
jgi:hypothetical protein